MTAPKTRTPAGEAPGTRPTSALNVPSDEQRDTFEWLALNADRSFRVIAAAIVPGFQPSTWDDYALAVQDLWDLNTGSDPFPFCPDEVDHHRFSAAEARAFAIDERTERRDSALAVLWDAIHSAAPAQEAS